MITIEEHLRNLIKAFIDKVIENHPEIKSYDDFYIKEIRDLAIVIEYFKAEEEK